MLHGLPLASRTLSLPRTNDSLRSLANRAAEGDAAAIQSLVAEVGGSMLHTVRKVLGNEHPDAEDVTQEAVLGLLRSLPRFRGECAVGHYAQQVALRTALHARRHFRTRGKLGEPGEVELGDPEDGSGQSPLEGALSRERRRIVRSLLAKLPAATAEAMAMHFMLGFTVEEVASAMNVSPNTVWSRLKLGKRALQQALERDERLKELLGGACHG
ncbi:MAG: RNA polymerase sigma factor [Polyangiaceae bacterium]|nr:RNA polymerase sigma factor [Polyangiaceae bacterium]